ncbi:hypothetical protein D3C73_1204090 [compost metagenome]
MLYSNPQLLKRAAPEYVLLAACYLLDTPYSHWHRCPNRNLQIVHICLQKVLEEYLQLYRPADCPDRQYSYALLLDGLQKQAYGTRCHLYKNYVNDQYALIYSD